MADRRRVSVNLELEVARYIGPAAQAATVTRRVRSEIDGLGDEADGTGRDMMQLAANTDVAAHQIDDLGDEALVTAAELAILERQMHSVGRAAREMDDGGIDLPSIGGGAGRAGGSFATGILGGLGHMSFRSKAIGALVGLAVIASPAIGAIIAGAVTGTVGLGGIAGGIGAASKDPRVRAAATEFGHSITTEFFGSGEAFVGPTIKALDILKADFRELNLTSAFLKGAPAVETFAGGVGDLVKNIMPGFNRVMERSPQLSAIMAQGLGDVGTSISDMLTTMIESKGVMDGLRAAFTLLSGIIRGTGNIVGFLSDRFHELANFSGEVTGVLEDWLGWMPLIGPMLRSVNDRSEEWSDTTEGLVLRLDRVTPAQLAANRAIGDLPPIVDDATDAVNLFNDATDTMLGNMLDVDGANLAVQRGLLSLKESIKENGKHWETNTRAGLANRDALHSQVVALDRQRRATIDAGGDAEKANAKFAAELKVLEGIARAAGISEAALRDLVGEYRITVITRNIQQYIEYRQGERSSSGRAAGGPVIGGNIYRVEEQVAEVFRPGHDWRAPMDGMVVPASQMRRGGGGGREVVNLTVQLVDAPNGKVLRTVQINDALARGVKPETVAAAFP